MSNPVGENVRVIRTALGLDLHALDTRMGEYGWPGADFYDEQAGLSAVGALQRLESGERGPLPGELSALALALSCRVADLRIERTPRRGRFLFWLYTRTPRHPAEPLTVLSAADVEAIAS